MGGFGLRINNGCFRGLGFRFECLGWNKHRVE